MSEATTFDSRFRVGARFRRAGQHRDCVIECIDGDDVRYRDEVGRVRRLTMGELAEVAVRWALANEPQPCPLPDAMRAMETALHPWSQWHVYVATSMTSRDRKLKPDDDYRWHAQLRSWMVSAKLTQLEAKRAQSTHWDPEGWL